uniref:non-specific serine/threonine protein kinase n=1 Tax=uncultured bacterium contig00040 TaxID=1181528 RepID=A0A806KMD9_9BACT|nr:hypothetical protein [uncultured bacterium contig00040]
MIFCMGCMEQTPDDMQVCPHCGYARGTPPREAFHIAPETILHGRYIVGRVLGFGGFGVTYIGWDAQLERKVAIKEFLPTTLATRMPGSTAVTVYGGTRSEQSAQFDEGLTRFIDEAQRLAKFNGLPGIVDIFDSFAENNTAYIIMQFLEGRDVKDVLKTEGPLPYDRALPIILTVAETLGQVHAQGIIHRDISPDKLPDMTAMSVGEATKILTDVALPYYLNPQFSDTFDAGLVTGTNVWRDDASGKMEVVVFISVGKESEQEATFAGGSFLPLGWTADGFAVALKPSASSDYVHCSLMTKSDFDAGLSTSGGHGFGDGNFEYMWIAQVDFPNFIHMEILNNGSGYDPYIDGEYCFTYQIDKRNNVGEYLNPATAFGQTAWVSFSNHVPEVTSVTVGDLDLTNNRFYYTLNGNFKKGEVYWYVIDNGGYSTIRCNADGVLLVENFRGYGESDDDFYARYALMSDPKSIMLMRYDNTEFSEDGSARYTFSRFGVYAGQSVQNMPDVAGMPVAQALGILQDAGIWPNITSDFSETVPAGHVISLGINSISAEVEIRFSRGPESAYQGATPQPLFLGFVRVYDYDKNPGVLYWAPESDDYYVSSRWRADGYGEATNPYGGHSLRDGNRWSQPISVMDGLLTSGDLGDTRPSNASFTLRHAVEYSANDYGTRESVYYDYDKPVRLTVAREKFIDSVTKDGDDYVIKSPTVDEVGYVGAILATSSPNEWGGRNSTGRHMNLHSYSWEDRGVIVTKDYLTDWEGTVEDLDKVLIYYTESYTVNPDGSVDMRIVYDEYVLNNR